MKRAALIAMLDLQSTLNVAVNPAWLTAGYPFLRAAFVESGEALDHYGWKWWKKQEPNLEQFGVELIDILHFYLSHVLVSQNGDIADAASYIEMQIGRSTTAHDIVFDDKPYTFASMDTLSRVELLAGLAVSRRVSFPLLGSLFADAGMADNDIFNTYVGKNVLNVFRQSNGYKQGTYIKDWFGEEDNQVMSRLLSELNGCDPITVPSVLKIKLEAAYKAVTNAATYA